MEERDYWLGFSVFSGVGPISFQSLLSKFTTAKNAWEASEKELLGVLREKKMTAFLQFRESFVIAEYKKSIKAANIETITLLDATYPRLLKQIHAAPFLLYVRGNIFLLNQENTQKIAIVGTRKVTEYGREVTELFAQELTQSGCIIISGLAMGVDAIAHKATIVHGGKTIAVLGCGVDCAYPRENQSLYDEILVSGGAIISEIPLGLSATVGTFPARNRIVAGMSDGIVVTQGAEDSGSLITAEFGFTYERKVFAVPGPILSAVSKGPYALIAKGAKLVIHPKDVLQELRMTNDELSGSTEYPRGEQIEKDKIMGDTKDEQKIIDTLEHEPMSFDEIVRTVHMDSAKVGSILSLMEVKGFIKTTATGLFSLVK